MALLSIVWRLPLLLTEWNSALAVKKKRVNVCDMELTYIYPTFWNDQQ